MGVPDWVKDAGAYAVGGLPALVAKKLLLDSPDAPPAEKIAAPPPPPDITDEAVQRARIAARKRVLIGQGMGGTFLSGPLGDGSAPPAKAATLSGY